MNIKLLPTLIISLMLLWGCAQQMNIRQPAVAGTFYPDNPQKLNQVIEDFLQKADIQKEGTLKAIIVPHAGYIYSGQTAAYGFKVLQQQLELIPKEKTLRFIVLAPSHRVPFGFAAAGNYTHYTTPLGDIALVKTLEFEMYDEAHEDEHALEVQLPFLQKITEQTGHKNIEIIPLVVGHLNSYTLVTKIVNNLEKYIDENTFFIISSDLSHYNELDKANKIDQQSIQNILSGDTHDIDACGFYPILIVNELAQRHDWNPLQLHYDTSATASDDTSRVVGYVSIAYYASQPDINGAELVHFARQVIETKIRKNKIFENETLKKLYTQKMGAFVTINKNNQLRGCIGYIQPVKSIYEAVRDNAISAATDDPRFAKVLPEELNDLHIEVSLLTVPVLSSFDEIKPGDGVVIKQGYRSATFLPQVWEQLPDKDEFFEHLCLKAGLPADEYKKGNLEFKKYEALVFEEE